MDTKEIVIFSVCIAISIVITAALAYRAGYRKIKFVHEPIGTLHVNANSMNEETLRLELNCTIPQLQNCTYVIFAVESDGKV